MSIIKIIKYHKNFCKEFSEDSKIFKYLYVFFKITEEIYYVLWAYIFYDIEIWLKNEEERIKKG
jgi:hypothetical protein